MKAWGRRLAQSLLLPCFAMWLLGIASQERSWNRFYVVEISEPVSTVINQSREPSSSLKFVQSHGGPNRKKSHQAQQVGKFQSSKFAITSQTSLTHPRQPPCFFDSTKSTANSVKMGRLHSNGKGISASAIPYSRNPPAWLKTTPEQVVDQICKLAKKGATPSQIGVILRDSHGIAQVKVVTGMLLSSIVVGLGRENGSEEFCC